MPDRHVVRTAIAMRGMAQRTARHATKATQRAVVVGLDPLQVELTQAGVTLDESQFVLSHNVRNYDETWGLALDDALVMAPVAGGELVAIGVISAATAVGGGAPSGPAGGVLSGTYPSPGFAVDMATQAELNARTPQITTGPIADGPPGSPSDKDIWIATDVDANGTRWQFQYHADSASSYKWEFVGGSPLMAQGSKGLGDAATINAQTQVGSTGYYYIPSMMSVTVPRAGDYLVQGQSGVYNNAGAATYVLAYTFAGSSTGPGRTESAMWVTAVNNGTTVPAQAKMTGLAASTVVGICVTTGLNGTYWFLDQQIVQVVPVRVS